MDFSLTVDGKRVKKADVKFPWLYKTLMKKKLKDISYAKQTDEVRRSHERMTGKDIKPAIIWKAARKQYCKHKTADLIWRLLHNKVLTGSRLDWVDPEKHFCPIDRKELTLNHI